MSDPSDEIAFLTVEVVLALHQRQLERFGGGAGLRDRDLLAFCENREPRLAGMAYALAAPRAFQRFERLACKEAYALKRFAALGYAEPR